MQKHNNNSENIVYLNNKYIPESQATISIFDRGFLFADGIYEVIPVYHGKVLFLDEHLQRLQQNLDKIQIKYSVDKDSWLQICRELIEHNGPNNPIYIQVTRGRDKTRLHNYPEDLTPTVIALSLPAIELGSCRKATNIKVITLDDIRWKLCNVKSIALLGNILLNQNAYNQGANEALLINQNGHIVEGCSTNYFMVKDNKVYTPKLNYEILPGITRKIVVDILNQHQIPLIEQDLTKQDLYNADEIWLTSSTREIRPVASIDNHDINKGKPGPMWQQVVTWYIDYIEQQINT